MTEANDVKKKYAELLALIGADEDAVMVTGCCDLGKGKTVLRIKGNWFFIIYAGGANGQIDLMSNGPINFCPNCGVKLDDLTDLLPYGWGLNGEMDDFVKRLGAVRPIYAVPFQIVKFEENGKGDEVQENEDG